VDLCWFEKEAAENDGVMFEQSPGDTQVADLVDRHEDAVRLDLRRLSTVASHIAVAIRRDAHLHQFTQREVLDILADATSERRLRLDGLKRDLKDAVRQHLDER